MKVLIALDQSNYSDFAFEAVKLRTWPDDTEFFLCTVVDNFVAASTYVQHQSIHALQRVRAESESVAAKMLEERTAEIVRAFPDAKVSLHIESGPASDRIVELAVDVCADLIILGSHGRRGIERYALGSVSESVVERAPCSVEIIKMPRTFGKDPLNQRRILVCYDGSRNAKACLEWIAEGQWSPEQEFVLTTVVAPLEDVHPPQITRKRKFEQMKADAFTEIQQMLESRCRILRDRLKSTQIQAQPLEGYAAEKIVEFADSWGADLIVLGAHSDGAPDYGSLGSVARRVVAGAKCFVKLVRAKAPACERART